MRKLLAISILAALLFCGKCDGDDDNTNCLTKDVHEYMDNVLGKARQELPDPMRLPPRSTIVELSDGVLWGMSNITRLGEAEVTCVGNIVTIKSKITTDELKGRYTWTKERRNGNWEGYVVFISHDFEAEADVVIEKSDNGKVVHRRLDRFEIKRFKDVKIEITGLSYLSWALGEITTLMSGIFQRAIASAVQDPLKEAIEREMREIPIE